ncbi:MAG: type II secretion system protein N [Sedimentisphaerales bacterium]|nr:type II secretion system protein N [Sedimentisphaerales bacterium]
MYIRKVLLPFKLALVLVLSFVIIRTVIVPQHPAGIFAPASAVGTENISSNRAENPVQAAAKDYSVIAAQNIFGADSSDAENESLQVSKLDSVVKLAEEELSLELVGTVCGNKAVSRAIIINTKTKLLGMYKTGHNIGEARIESIEEEAVILFHNGQRKMLILNRIGRDNKNNTQMLSSAAINKTDEFVDPVISVKQSFDENPTKVSHLEMILSNATIEPYIVDGQIEGLKINNLEKIPLAKVIGLKDGDIISHINGQRLTSKQKAFQVFKKARSEATMSLELLSDGETKELSLTLP